MIGLLAELKKGKLKHEEQQDTYLGFATVEESDIGKRNVDVKITDDLLVAQAIIFFIAGFDTMSTILSFCVYELAMNLDVQQKLHEEIDEAFTENNGKVSYEEIVKMKYLDMVISSKLCQLLAPFYLILHTNLIIY